MPSIASKCVALALLATAPVSLAASQAAAAHYAVARKIAGPDGGWDYAKVDPASRKLYVARGTEVTVIDLANGDRMTTLGPVVRGHAVVPVPGGKLLLVTSGRDDSVRLFDIALGLEAAKIAVGANPDAAYIDAASGHAIVMNAKDGTVSVIDITKRSVVKTIRLKAGLEYALTGPADTLFVNNEDANEVETANLTTGKVGPTFALAGCSAPSGLGFDAKTGLIISACANGKAAIVNARTMKLVKLIDIGQGPDAVIVDEARRTAFIPCGRDGTLAVIALDGKNGPTVVETIKTGTGARTGALDTSDGSLYLPAAEFGAPTSAGGRPVVIPGSFHVLVVIRR